MLDKPGKSQLEIGFWRCHVGVAAEVNSQLLMPLGSYWQAAVAANNCLANEEAEGSGDK